MPKKHETMSRNEAALFDAKEDREWLNPINMSKLQIAVKKKAKTVALGSMTFDISYGHKFTSKVTGETRECVKLQRNDGGYVPFGYVSLKRIMSFDFNKGE